MLRNQLEKKISTALAFFSREQGCRRPGRGAAGEEATKGAGRVLHLYEN